MGPVFSSSQPKAMRSSFYVGSCCLVGQGKVVLLIIISSAMYNKSPISITATAFSVML